MKKTTQIDRIFTEKHQPKRKITLDELWKISQDELQDAHEDMELCQRMLTSIDHIILNESKEQELENLKMRDKILDNLFYAIDRVAIYSKNLDDCESYLDSLAKTSIDGRVGTV